MLSGLRTAAAPVMWGTTYLTTTEFLPAHRPLLVATVRALVAGLILLAVVRRLPERQWLLRIAALGALNIGGFFALLFLAASRLPGGVAAVVTSSQPVMVLALTPALLGRRVRGLQVVAAGTAVGGVALLVLSSAARLDGVGLLAALGAAGCSALGLVLTRRWQPPVGAWTLTAWQLTVGGLVLLPLTLLIEGLPSSLSGSAVAGFVWLVGPSTIGGYYLWFRGLGRMPAEAVAALGLLSPLTAAALGWLFLGQALGPVQIGGAALALGAVVLLQRTGARAVVGTGRDRRATVARPGRRGPWPTCFAPVRRAHGAVRAAHS